MNYKFLRDSELVNAVSSGDLKAFDMIVSRYKNVVFTCALNILNDHHAAEDVSQETFIDFYFSMSHLKDSEKLFSYLYGIAKRKALQYAKRKRTYVDIDMLSEFLPDDVYPDEIVLKNERISEVRKAIYALSYKNRCVAEMFYFDGLPLDKISERLKLPIGSVKSRLFEARKKLKGELWYMNSNKNTLPEDFEEKVKKQISKLQYYYAINGSSDGYEHFSAQTKEMAKKLTDADKRAKALSDILFYDSWYDEKLEKESLDAAISANNPIVVSHHLVNELFKINDKNKWIEFIDEKALPEMKKMKSEHGKGILLLWRGRGYLELENIEKAYSDFSEAAKLIDKSDNYHACAVSAMKAIDLTNGNIEHLGDGFHITAETLIQDGNRILFLGQPGFTSNSNLLYRMHKYSSLTYYLSRANRLFFDPSLKIGEKTTSADNKCNIEMISQNEKVSVKAGVFDNCIHFHLDIIGEYTADSYFAPDIGLVKAVFRADNEESYELTDYSIKGGSGYCPMCEENRWSYENPNLPDYVYQKYEIEIDHTDGESANYAVLSVFTPKKDYIEKYVLDGEIYITEADNQCDSWDVDSAIKSLQKSVRANTSERTVFTALGGIEYLTHFKEAYDKNYRICPSSYNTSFLTLGEDGKSWNYDEAAYSFGPYKYGTRHEENRIFGVKPFRYLQMLLGYVFNEEIFKDGYKTVLKDQDWDETANIELSVENIGTLTTSLGCFEDCLKVAINAELKDKSGNYYFNDYYRYTNMGKKEFYFAKGYGIVKFDFTWGTMLKSSSELVECEFPAADEESYFPVQIGNRWEYEEVNLARENYRARRIIKVACGMNDKYLLNDSQEFWYNGTEEEYEKFKASIKD